MPRPTFKIATEGDLEVAAIAEGHGLLADIIAPQLYQVVGEEGDQMISFHSHEAFQLFSIRIGELISEAAENSALPGVKSNLSLLDALRWAASRLPEPSGPGLQDRVAMLSAWLAVEDPCRFWCPGLERELTFTVSRELLWRTHANNVKHTFVRLQKVLSKLERWTLAEGYRYRTRTSFTSWTALAPG